jgi:RecQ-mediated genome instability protein 1
VVRLPLPTPDSSTAAEDMGDGDGDGTQTQQHFQQQFQGGGQQQNHNQHQQQQQQHGISSSTTTSNSKNSTHKLLVQDSKGQTAQAIELRRVDRLAVGKTFIGEKMLLRAGTVVARGVVLLDPAQCVVLGGKVDAWHRAWVDGRLARLREAVGAERRGE